MKNTRKILLFTASLVIAAVFAASAYLYRDAQLERAEQARTQLEEGIAQFRKGQNETALQTLQAVPGNLVDDWRLPYYTGSAMIRLRDYDGAVVQLEKALELNSGEQNILFALGVVYYKLGNLSLSKGYFASVLEVDPGHLEAKGLMDIMASLERYSAEQSGPDGD